jgi:WD40 repeat protein
MLRVAIDRQGRFAATVTWPYGAKVYGRVRFGEIASGRFEDLPAHGNQVTAVALDPSGDLVATGDHGGIVRVGPVSGEEVHLLIGHDTGIFAIAFTPDGKKLLSVGGPIIRSWRLPEGKPLLDLDSRSFIAGLEAFTNVRMLEDEAAPNGYHVGLAPFTGWMNEPQWPTTSTP